MTEAWATGGRRTLIVGALLLAAVRPLPAQAQLDGLIDRLVRPAPPPTYPYYYRPPPPAYPPAYYPPAYRPYYPPVYAPAAPRPAVSVMEAQRMLDALGYDAGAVDGVAGPRVSDAVRAFQRDHGQAADGRLTGETMAALRAALHEREAAPQPASTPEPTPAPVAASASAAMPTEGKYCLFDSGKSYTMLLARDQGGDLSFALDSWAPNGSNFSVSGNATMQSGQWRYEDGMRSKNPDEHCRVTIARLPDGGFRFATDPAARCESSGGHGSVPYAPLLFSAALRTGNPPRDMTDLAQVGCDRPRGVALRAEPSPGLLFPATAQAGPESRAVRFRFYCYSDAGSGQRNLSLGVTVPDTDALQGTIDLDAMEGPYPKPAPHVTLQVKRADGEDPVEAGFTGSASRVDAAVMEVGMTEAETGARRPKLLATAIAALAEGQGQLVFQLQNPASDKPALEATLPVSQADAAALRQSLRACLAGR